MYPLSFLQNAPFGKEVCNHINCKFQLNVHIPLLNLCQTNIPKSTQFLQKNDFAAKNFSSSVNPINATTPPVEKKSIWTIKPSHYLNEIRNKCLLKK